ncbi:MAG: tetratricopeptide repeat protein [Flavobacteriaceae bacterium]
MSGILKTRFLIGWYFVFLPVFLKAQLYNQDHSTELTNHFFGLDYFPTSWQSSVFEEDVYSTAAIQEKVEFNTLSNALRLNYSGAEKMLEQYKEDNPITSVSKNIDWDVANYYFNSDKYRYALKWFARISENEVPKMDQAAFNFKKGYSLFSAKQFKKAKPYLEKVKNNKTYESDAHYYLGHIAYQLEDYEGANTSFNSITNSYQKEDLAYFQADMNFRLGRFDQAVTLAKEALKNAEEQAASELSKIIGESYFNQQKYDLAIPYLEAYKGKKGTWENLDYYQLGFAYFKEKYYEQAVGQFNKIIGKKDALAQNAYYTLAECYLATGQKTAALNAFKSASSMNFIPVITEDAFLNYAKLSYDIGNPYEETPKVIISFLEAYPKSNQQDLLKALLIDSYTKEGNYTAALEILENNSAFKSNETLQRVLILNAIQEYQSGHFQKANILFEKSLKLKENDLYHSFALYWKGRTEYELNQFDAALGLFKEFRKHPLKNQVQTSYRLEYDMGYVYFKLGEYEYALKSFEAFDAVNSELDVAYQRDTFLRMADSHFALKKYWPAMEFYTLATNLEPEKGAYAVFQKGICYGFVDRNPKKIELLEAFLETYKSDGLEDDVLFELAAAFTKATLNAKAIDAYDKLLTRFTNSPYLARAALNKGLILYNQENYESAKEVLKEVALNYKRYAPGEQAIRTLKEIALDQGTVSDFKEWITSNDLGSYTDIEFEKTTFNAAEKQFLEGNTKMALKLFEEYVTNYPEGAFSIESSYYLAELYFENERYEEALNAYKVLVDGQVTSYTEKALSRSITILKNLEMLPEAIPYLEKLSETASLDENRRFAKMNLMQAYYKEQQYEKSLQLSDEVLLFIGLEDSVKWDALFIQARSALALKDTLKAAATYQLIEKSPLATNAVEALYFKAEQYYNNQNYKASIQWIEKIAVKGQVGKWNVKALLLLAKNYFALKDGFQAVFVLESLIENFNSFEDEVKEARVLIEAYQLQMSEENRSLNNQVENE